MTLTHRGAFDESAVSDLLTSLGSQINSVALAANAVIPPGLITGPAADIYLVNSTANPGNQTTRTAAQLYADLLAEFNVANVNGFTFALRITTGQGTGALTLVAGTGVTLVGTMTVAANTFRDFIVQVFNSGAVTITSQGTGTYS